MKTLTDNQIEGICIEPATRPYPSRGVGTVDGSEDVSVVVAVLDFIDWWHLPSVAEALMESRGQGLDGAGFFYSDDLDPDDEPFEGVKVYTPFDEVAVSRLAFERLMARFFRALIIGAESTRDQVMQQSWWPIFKNQAGAIEARVTE